MALLVILISTPGGASHVPEVPKSPTGGAWHQFVLPQAVIDYDGSDLSNHLGRQNFK